MRRFLIFIWDHPAVCAGVAFTGIFWSCFVVTYPLIGGVLSVVVGLSAWSAYRQDRKREKASEAWEAKQQAWIDRLADLKAEERAVYERVAQAALDKIAKEDEV